MPYKNFSRLSLLLVAFASLSSQVLEARTVAARLIYARGYHSCSYDQSRPFKLFQDAIAAATTAAEQRAQTSEDVLVDASAAYFCFDSGYWDHSNDPREKLFHKIIDHNNVSTQHFEGNPAETPYKIADQYHKEAVALQAEGVEMPMRVFIAGHSHGGWLAMRIVNALSGDPLIKVERLLTIDPVSYYYCPSDWFVWNRIAYSMPNWGGTSIDDCHRSPRDLEHLGPRISDGASNNWTNVYETTMPFVSSGPIASATENINLPWTYSSDYWTGHLAIHRDPRSWQGFLKGMTDDINALVNPTPQ